MENTDNLIQEDEFEVEAILDYRKITKTDEKTKKVSVVEEYLIKWLNFDEQSWEPLSNLDNCQELLNDFKKKMKKKNPSNSRKKTSKSKKSLNTSKNINRKILKVKEKLTEIAKVPKSCLKTPKPKKKKNQKENNSEQNTSYNNIKTKTEGINLKKEKTPRTPNKERKDKKDKKDKNKENIPQSNRKIIIKNYDKNRYVLYRGVLVEKPIFFDFNNSIPANNMPAHSIPSNSITAKNRPEHSKPAQKSIYDKITFDEIFPPDDKFGKVENNIGKRRKKNNL